MMKVDYIKLAKEAVFYSLESGDYETSIESYCNHFETKYKHDFDAAQFLNACNAELFGAYDVRVYFKDLELE